MHKCLIYTIYIQHHRNLICLLSIARDIYIWITRQGSFILKTQTVISHILYYIHYMVNRYDSKKEMF